MAKICFFAQFREQIGVSHTEIHLPPQITTVGELLNFLSILGEPYATIVNLPHVQIAVNHQYARSSFPITDQDEIALFPPVTGG